MILLQIIFWLSLALLFHSYWLFPAIMQRLARKRKSNEQVFSKNEALPEVTILLSVYNEEKVIEQKIRNIFATTYPSQLLRVIVGSDGSTDTTNEQLKRLQLEFPLLTACLFTNRNGKSEMLNTLVAKANSDILIMTDAKVMFTENTIFELVKHFRNEKIGIVGGNIVNHNIRNDGISMQEKVFMSREMQIKYHEGIVCGYPIGVYGACYAFRGKLFSSIPKGYAVDDFFVTFEVYRKGYKGMMEMDALCFENVPNQMSEEFRRKVRISSGNFQNLATFAKLLLQPNALQLCYISHKVIRWIGPFLMIAIFISNAIIINLSIYYVVALIIQLLLIIIPLIDILLRKIHFHNITLRFVTHFYSMNLALLVGFTKYLKGTKTNVWEPTTRQH